MVKSTIRHYSVIPTTVCRHSFSGDAKPESYHFNKFHNLWATVFTRMTIIYETISYI